MGTITPFTTSIVLYLMYLAFFRLLLVISTKIFLNLKHEVVVTGLNIVSAVIVTGSLLAEVLLYGTTCNITAAQALIYIKVGIKPNWAELAAKLGKHRPFPWPVGIIVVTMVFYLISYIVDWATKRKEKQLINKPCAARLESGAPFFLIPKRTNLIYTEENLSTFDLSSQLKPVPPPVLVLTRDDNSNTIPSGQDGSELKAIPLSKKHLNAPNKILVINNEEETQSTHLHCTSPHHLIPIEDTVESDAVSLPLASTSRLKVFQRVSFTLGSVLLISLSIRQVADLDNPVVIEVLGKFFKYVLECMPMYWLLMVDDCYAIFLRRTKAWLANNFRIY